MSDMISKGLAWQARMLKAAAGQTVIYRRGAASVPLSAVKGRSAFEVVDSGGLASTIESTDYLILPADLVLDGQVTLPAAGDRIDEVSGGITYVHELMNLPGVPAWKYNDPHRSLLRVHTKLVRTQEAS